MVHIIGGTPRDGRKFFRHLEKELIQGEKYLTCQEAVSAIFEYIEVFYNRQRKHSKRGCQSPVEFDELQTKNKQNKHISQS